MCKEFTVRVSMKKSRVQRWWDVGILIDAVVMELNFKNAIDSVIANALDVS